MAQHPGNERFRALIQARHDTSYCQNYTAEEKKAVADEIIRHIQSLVPSGRFLKRPGRAKGLEGPWSEMTEKETMKKTCQALRDCSRPDRTGYAKSVTAPEDVQISEQERSKTGMTNKQLAEKAVTQAEMKRARDEEEEESMRLAGIPEPTPIGVPLSEPDSLFNAAAWLKKQKIDPSITPMPHATPATAVSSGGLTTLHDDSSDMHHHHHHHSSYLDDDDDDEHDYAPLVATTATDALLSTHPSFSPAADAAITAEAIDHPFSGELSLPYEDTKPSPPAMIHHRRHSSSDLIDPLQLAAAAAAEFGGTGGNHSLSGEDHPEDVDFGPPSPLHATHDVLHGEHDIPDF